ncbi:MAG: hypothetical protein WCP29_18895 [Acidobacteriota bacterium]
MGEQETLFLGRNDADVQEQEEEWEVKQERIERTKHHRESEKWEDIQEVEGVARHREGELSNQVFGVLFEHRVCAVSCEKRHHPFLAE